VSSSSPSSSLPSSSLPSSSLPSSSLEPDSRPIDPVQASNPSPDSRDSRGLHLAISRQVDRDLGVRGQIVLPCNPEAIEANVNGLVRAFRLLGRIFSEVEVTMLKQQVAKVVTESETELSVNSLTIAYAAAGAGLRYRVAKSSAVLDTVAFRGVIMMPAIPSLRDGFCQRLLTLFALLDRPASEEDAQALRQLLDRELKRAYDATPHARVSIRYESTSPPEKRVACNIESTMIGLTPRAESLLEQKPDYLEALAPHAKITELLAAGDLPPDGEALVVGVATAQYALPLAAEGWEVTALDLAAPFVERLDELTLACGGNITALHSNLLQPEVILKPEVCNVAIVHNFATRMQSTLLLRELLLKLLPAIQPKGFGAIELFVPLGDYEPDAIAREAARATGSTIFTRPEIAHACQDLPLTAIELTHHLAYEAQHRPQSAPPLESSYVHWASGRQVFAMETPPIALHWLTFRRTEAPMPTLAMIPEA
jgi:hypothetical protein